MIRCLQCGFENPDEHNFCQQCGAAIAKSPLNIHQDNISTNEPRNNSDSSDLDTHNPQLPSSLKVQDRAQDVGIKSYKINEPAQLDYPEWLAILSITSNNNADFARNSPTPSIHADTSKEYLNEKLNYFQERGYLDSKQRYRIDAWVTSANELESNQPLSYLELIVVDETPSKSTYLDQVLSKDNQYISIEKSSFDSNTDSNTENLSELISIIPDTEEINIESLQDPNKARNGESTDSIIQDSLASTIDDTQSKDNAQSVFDDGVVSKADTKFATKKICPSIALVYLEVEDQFYPSLPQIHDAWIDDNVSIVIVENRNNLELLQQTLQDPKTKLLQVFHWLHEMTEILAVLEPKGYQQSLFYPSNLHIDEDHILCITRLYPASNQQQDSSLKLLGNLWQQLLDKSPLQDEQHLLEFVQALQQGTIESIDDLRAHLEDVAMQLHDNEMVSEQDDLLSSDNDITSNLLYKDLTAQQNHHDTESPTYFDMDRYVIESFPEQDNSEQEFLDESLDLNSENDEAPTVVLPMRLSNLVDAGLTDIGRQRDHNEDYFSIQSETQKQDTPAGRTFAARGLYVLCDGMGGHAAGEVASALAVSSLEGFFKEKWTEYFPSKDMIQSGIQIANQSIYDLNQEKACHGSGRMGTTLVMMLLDGIRVAIAHVGDSRAYRFCRRTGLEQITVDHEVGQREIQRGVEPDIAYARPDAYQLTQALGPREGDFIKPDIQMFDVNEDTLFILCSDGLSDNQLLEQYCDSHIEPLLSSQMNLNQGLCQLIDLANQHNGHDNITAIAIRMKVRPKIQGFQ